MCLAVCGSLSARFWSQYLLCKLHLCLFTPPHTATLPTDPVRTLHSSYNVPLPILQIHSSHPLSGILFPTGKILLLFQSPKPISPTLESLLSPYILRNHHPLHVLKAEALSPSPSLASSIAQTCS